MRSSASRSGWLSGGSRSACNKRRRFWRSGAKLGGVGDRPACGEARMCGGTTVWRCRGARVWRRQAGSGTGSASLRRGARVWRHNGVEM
eukprot:365951-Chlamydomonas_euryale.AAC.6